MSMIEADVDAQSPASGANGTRKVLTEKVGMKEEHISDEDVRTVRRVVQLVGTRAARLSATAVAGTMFQTGAASEDGSVQGKEVNIGFDGSLAELYPHFEERLRAALREVLGEDVERKTKFGLAKDGSGVGAALGAAAAKKQADAGHRVS
jgi:hexokinase